MKKNLKDYELNELKTILGNMGEASYRAGQIFAWLYKGAESFEEMKNIPMALRERIGEEYSTGALHPSLVQVSKIDGTRKYLFELEDGNAIESVFMKYKYGNTICISSQAGCRMGCRFCASTLDGLCRDLTPGGDVRAAFGSSERYGRENNPYRDNGKRRALRQLRKRIDLFKNSR